MAQTARAQMLRFSSAERTIERPDRTRWFSSELSRAKRDRLGEKLAAARAGSHSTTPGHVTDAVSAAISVRLRDVHLIMWGELSFVYLCDFRDTWQHKVTLEKLN